MRCAIAASSEVLDQIACRAFFVRRLHPAGALCPYCRVAVNGRQAETFAAGGRLRCNACQKWFTYRTGTPLHDVKTDDRQVFLLLMLTGAGCSPELIADICRLSDPATVTNLQRRFRECCA